MFPRGLLREYATPLSVIARILDILCVLIGGLAAYYWRFGNFDVPTSYQILLILGILLTFIIFPLAGIYRSWRGSHWFSHVRTVAGAWFLVLIILIIIGFLTKTSTIFSRQWFMVWALFSGAMLVGIRMSLQIALRRIRTKGLNRRRIIIIGAGDLGINVVKNIKEALWAGYEIVAFFDDDADLHGRLVEGIKIYGGIDKINEFLAKEPIDEILLALPLAAKSRIEEILHELRHVLVTIRFVPDLLGLRLINHSVTEFAGLPVINLTESPMTGANKIIKAVEDRAVALLLLILTSPLFLLISIAIKLDSPGPIFYRQKRVSWNGNSFTMLKFRTMAVDAESDTGPVWRNKDHNRTTRLGRFLRKTSLDELPQFLNVLSGEMSIVGPRPERPYFVEQFKEEVPDYMKKHLVKAGITGWAQINGWRGNTCLKTRIQYDLYYVENWSLWFDIKIMFMTLFKGFVHRNAY
jgi:putative colanic acid biosynthesis UDP-glucose lipid carrier transferase